MTKKTVCFVCLGKWDSTLCLRAKSIGENLEKSGWSVTFLIPDIIEHQGLDSANIHLMPTKLLSFLWASRSILKRLRPSFIHFLNPEVKAVLLSMFAVPRSCQVIGDWEDWHAISRDSGLKKYATRFSDWFMRKRSDIVITASRWLADEFESVGVPSPHYIPYAMLPREFPKLPNPFQHPTAVFMGSFHSNWDHDILIDAASELKARGLAPPIFLIGRGEDLNRCKDVCRKRELHNVQFSGYLDWDDMLNRLQWAHVLLFPIRDKIANKARCPFKVFQYAQAKRPILTCRVGEVPTFLDDKAIYVEATATAFADELERVMASPRMENVDYGIEAHTWESRTEDFIAAIGGNEAVY